MTHRLIEDADHLTEFAERLAAGHGPIALDAERASGFRYSQRAYLIQVHRAGSDIGLIDPIAVPDLAPLAASLTGAEWVLHAASQDLPCLFDLGLRPTSLFDTELAGRLLGFERVNLAAMLEQELHITIRKGQGATDWSQRPLNQAQIEYAALDVAHLIALRTQLATALHERGKWHMAEQEFAALVDFTPKPAAAEPWRRLSGIHELRQPRQLGVARQIWLARDERARLHDIAPGRIFSDRSIVALARTQPADVQRARELVDKGAAETWWWHAYEQGRALPDVELPQRLHAEPGAAPPRQWARKHPDAFARWEAARAALLAHAAELEVPIENLLAPAIVRQLSWDPPDDIAQGLRALGARPWQVEEVMPILPAALEVTPAEVTGE